MVSVLKVDINSASRLKVLAKRWQSRGKEVRTLYDLIRCYYCDISIVCIPQIRFGASPSLIVQQYRKLGKALENAAEKTYEIRKTAQLLLVGARQDSYIRHALNHFCVDPSKPFDFMAVEAGDILDSASAGTKRNIIKIASRLIKNDGLGNGVVLFHALASLFASYIFLDDTRRNGLPRDVGMLVYCPNLRRTLSD